MEKHDYLTHKEAVKKALEELGGRAKLAYIYPRVIPYIKFKPGSDIKATLRRLLQTTPDLFRHTEGMKGWYELVSYQEELAEKDRVIAELMKSQVTKERIIEAFNDYDSFTERMFAKMLMIHMFRGLPAWESAYKELKKSGYFAQNDISINISNNFYGPVGQHIDKVGKIENY